MHPFLFSRASGCLRLWLEQDTVCPTCRSSLSDELETGERRRGREVREMREVGEEGEEGEAGGGTGTGSCTSTEHPSSAGYPPSLWSCTKMAS